MQSPPLSHVQIKVKDNNIVIDSPSTAIGFVYSSSCSNCEQAYHQLVSFLTENTHATAVLIDANEPSNNAILTRAITSVPVFFGFKDHNLVGQMQGAPTIENITTLWSQLNGQIRKQIMNTTEESGYRMLSM